MKKLGVNWVVLASLLISIPSVSAQENRTLESEESFSLELSRLTEESGKDTASIFSLAKTDKTLTGVFGTVPWTWEQKTGTLTFGGREFPATNYNTNIRSIIECISLSNEQSISKIIFTTPIKTNTNSSYLFYDLTDLSKIENLEKLDTRYVFYVLLCE